MPTNPTQKQCGEENPAEPFIFPTDETELPPRVHGVLREKHKTHGEKLKQQTANFCTFVRLVPSLTAEARRTVKYGL